MQIDRIFLTVNAQDHAKLVAWWSDLLGSPPMRTPVPSCREWDLADNILFQVIDASEPAAKLTLTARVDGLGIEIARLRAAGIEVPEPQKVPDFENLLITQFHDPEGNEVNLLEGALGLTSIDVNSGRFRSSTGKSRSSASGLSPTRVAAPSVQA